MQKVINVGLAAFGLSGEFFHAPFITSMPGFRLVKVQERHQQKSKQKYPFVEVVKTFEELIADPTIDLIIITTPNHLHFEMAKKALQAGKHVIVEKPFTPTSAEALELTQLAKKQNKLLTVYQNRRWDGDFLTIKKLLENNMLGGLVEYEAHFDRFRTDVKRDKDNSPNWKELPEQGSGYLYDLGSHLIDQALVLFGKPETVFANIRTLRSGSQVPDSFEIILSYPSIKVTLKSSILVREPGPRYTLHGSKGSFVKYGIDPQEDALKAGLLPGSAKWGEEKSKFWGTLNTEINGLHFRGPIETLPGNYTLFYQNIYEAIMNGKRVEVSPEQATDTIRIIELAMESHKQQRVLPFGF